MSERDWKKIYRILLQQSKNPTFDKWTIKNVNDMIELSFMSPLHIPIHVQQLASELSMMWFISRTDRNYKSHLSNNQKKQLLYPFIRYKKIYENKIE